MAHPRLIPALLVVAACGRAGAQPAEQASGITAPAGWQALPALAAAARIAAAAPGVTVGGAEAWGEPAMGCYAVWMMLHGSGGDAAALADQIRAGAGEAGLELTGVVAPAGGEGVLAAAFAKPPHRGRLRARLGGGRIAALACFGNQREPRACEATCTGVLGAIK